MRDCQFGCNTIKINKIIVMKKSLFFAFLIAGAAGLFACGGEEPNNGGEWVPPAPIPNENAIDIPNHNFEDGLEHWTIKNWHMRL